MIKLKVLLIITCCIAWQISSERFFKEREIPSGIRVAIGKEYIKSDRAKNTSGTKLHIAGGTCKQQPEKIEIISIEAKNSKGRRIYSGEVQMNKHDYEKTRENHQITIGSLLIDKRGKVKKLNRYKPHLQEISHRGGKTRIMYSVRIKEKYMKKGNIEKVLPTLVIEGCTWISQS